jgi:hypothetical protein
MSHVNGEENILTAEDRLEGEKSAELESSTEQNHEEPEAQYEDDFEKGGHESDQLSGAEDVQRIMSDTFTATDSNELIPDFIGENQAVTNVDVADDVEATYENDFIETPDYTSSDKVNLQIGDNRDDSSSDIENAATKIQSAFRGFKTRKEISNQVKTTLMDANPQRVGDTGISTDHLTKPIDSVTHEEFTLQANPVSQQADRSKVADEEGAAIKIQAVFRGHQVRSSMQQSQTLVDTAPTFIRQEDKPVNEKPQTLVASHDGLSEDENAKEYTSDNNRADTHEIEAATKIQSIYRGFKVRRRSATIGSEQESNPRGFTGSTLEEVHEIHHDSTKVSQNKQSVEPEKTEFGAMELESENTELNKLGETPISADDAAVKIQSIFRGYKVRRESIDPASKKTHENSDIPIAGPKSSSANGSKEPSRRSSRNSVSESVQSSKSHDEEDGANKGAYRDFQDRRQSLLNKSIDESEEPPEAESQMIQANAAKKIQSIYRGFSVRKNLHGVLPSTSTNRKNVITEEDEEYMAYDHAPQEIIDSRERVDVADNGCEQEQDDELDADDDYDDEEDYDPLSDAISGAPELIRRLTIIATSKEDSQSLHDISQASQTLTQSTAYYSDDFTSSIGGEEDEDQLTEQEDRLSCDGQEDHSMEYDYSQTDQSAREEEIELDLTSTNDDISIKSVVFSEHGINLQSDPIAMYYPSEKTTGIDDRSISEPVKPSNIQEAPLDKQKSQSDDPGVMETTLADSMKSIIKTSQSAFDDVELFNIKPINKPRESISSLPALQAKDHDELPKMGVRFNFCYGFSRDFAML